MIDTTKSRLPFETLEVDIKRQPLWPVALTH